MILNTGSRTDIPAFYSRWLRNRFAAGEVMARNPFAPQRISRYQLRPDLVDAVTFCTKNPAPLMADLAFLEPYRSYWMVTITPYGKDIEPFVPDKHAVIASVQQLSSLVGRDCIAWRYDPILITQKYTEEYHLRAFRAIASALAGSVSACIISFLDLYQKTVRNFPEAREVSREEMNRLAGGLMGICREYGIPLKACLEDPGLAAFGIDTSGCMTQAVLEQALQVRLKVPSSALTRNGCRCVLGNDIGAYSSCGHGCRYCYANQDMAAVRASMRRHDPDSPLLIGRPGPDDIITDAVQTSWLQGQLSLPLDGC